MIGSFRANLERLDRPAIWMDNNQLADHPECAVCPAVSN